MDKNLKQCIVLLKDNDDSVRQGAEDVLLKLCRNVLNNPKDLHYRKIKLSNAVVSNKLLIASGAIECLFEIGFIENDDEFLLPIETSLDNMRELYNYLKNTNSKPSTSNEKVIPSSSSSSCSSSSVPSVKHENKISSAQLSNAIKQVQSVQQYKKKSFFEKFNSQFQQVLRYEDKSLQAKARSIIPLEKLQMNAMTKLREIQREIKVNPTENDVVIEDLVLAELLQWFKFKFFKWIDSPECSKCMGDCSYIFSRTSVNPQISRYEVYECKNCGSQNDFPRYTDPECLLYFRKGRCGEWANCFTLICRTVGFDARLVNDETDHLWTEVWSDAHQRWIHADPCENAMDTPLMYEKGWGKKLTYVIAFSKDEIQDVTWRYTRDFKEVLKRRNHCSEEALVLFINKLNIERQNSGNYSAARKKYVAKRSAFELAEMLTAPPGFKKPSEELENSSDYGGRTSGSLAWRISRGETNTAEFQPFQWTVPKEISKFELIYSITEDVYTIKDSCNDKVLETKKNWQNGIDSMSGKIFRKEEHDWKMVYLARSQGTQSGKISWTFTIDDEKKCFDTLEVRAITETFHGANIKWEVEGTKYSGDQKVKFNFITSKFDVTDFKEVVKFSISAVLSGGSGVDAWQHAQLFRQRIDSKEPALRIYISLKDKI